MVGFVENQYEPGSRELVLKNLLGITSKKKIESVETEAYSRAMEEFIKTYDREHRFTATDLCHMHRIWLGSIYEWAGRYRLVNLSKEGFLFAVPEFISKLMDEFDRGELYRYTPCKFKLRNEVITALSVVHTELILIHPFREGNGRVARLLAALMALQAGLPFLDFSDIQGEKKGEYEAAVRSGMKRDYEPMEEIFRTVISRSL